VALLSHLAPQHGADGGTSLVHGKRVLELGAGTGLVGLSCALLGASSVVLTDMVDVVPLLTLNAALNTQLLDDVAGGSSAGAQAVSAAEMLWGCAAHVEAHDAFELVVMADCVYDPAGYEPLLQTLNFLCDRVDPASPPLLIVLAHRHRHPEDWRFFRETGSGLALEFCELNDWAMLNRQRNCSCEKQNNCLIQTLNRGPRLTAYGTSFDSA
jgi:hypothetical protein